jgi:DNA excision repair protein ERCC-4
MDVNPPKGTSGRVVCTSTHPHSDLRPEDITAVIDTREQAPLDLLLKTERATLACADYSVAGLEHLIAVERKSLPDLLMCVGRERTRFDACIKRMQSYEVRVLVVEASWGSIALGQWRSQLKPTQVKAALYSWMKHVSVVLAGDRQSAANIVSGILFSAARERWRELRSFRETLKLAPQKEGA